MWIIGSMALRLESPTRRRIVLSGAVLGAFIGLLGFWLKGLDGMVPDSGSAMASASTAVIRVAGRIRSFGSAVALLSFFAVPFLGTLILMPGFLRWLEARADRSRRSFYLRAAAGGIAFGTLATALIAAALMVAAIVAGGFAESTKTTPDNGAALLFGGLIFVPFMGLSAPFFFFPYIIAAGIPFGVFFGGLVRRFGRPSG
jgi:hypothetical protein